MKSTNEFSAARFSMVQHQLAARGVRDRRVLAAMRRVPRERFVPAELADQAYDDEPLPIGDDQTISQPYIVAFMIEALGLHGNEKVLEIGTGSGYAAAVLSQLVAEVYTVERIERLATSARQRLQALDCANVHVISGDGTRGWPEQAPYDAIIVAAGGPQVPPTLKSQLKIGGRIVIPVGPTINEQRLTLVNRVSETQYETRYIAHVRFVPLLGDEGWNSSEKSGPVKTSLDPFDDPT